MKPTRFSIQIRPAGTFVVVLAILGAGIWLQEKPRPPPRCADPGHPRREHTLLLGKIVQLMGNPLHFFVSDYAPWDDLVQFVDALDKDRGDTNIHAHSTISKSRRCGCCGRTAS